MGDDHPGMLGDLGSTERSEPGGGASSSGPQRPVLVGGAIAAVVILVLLGAFFLLSPDDAGVADASPSPCLLYTSPSPRDS